jgi:hypothetical protein
MTTVGAFPFFSKKYLIKRKLKGNFVILDVLTAKIDESSN